MGTFAIVRQDGEVDKVEGMSVQDISDRYGAPGNGRIESWNDDEHGAALRYTFASPAEQSVALNDRDRTRDDVDVPAPKVGD
jgi:hypothetical protein